MFVVVSRIIGMKELPVVFDEVSVMFVVVTYDVNTETPEGKRRLRHVAKICKDYGVRVQNSVFECVVDSVELMELKGKIGEVMCCETDSVRYYNLGNEGRRRVEHVGVKPALNVDNR